MIYTVGYEGVDLPALIATLRAAHVAQLIDVRELPSSRRKGFSKRALSEALAVGGISYLHIRGLGSPREIRHRLRKDHDLRGFFAAFHAYLSTQEVLLDGLAAVLGGNSVLLCYERDPRECHRSIVAEALSLRTGAGIQHLMVPRSQASISED